MNVKQVVTLGECLASPPREVLHSTPYLLGGNEVESRLPAAA